MKKSINSQFKKILGFMFVSILLFASCSEDDNEISNNDTTTTLEFNGKSYSESDLENESKNITNEDIARMLQSHYGITEVNKIDDNNNKLSIGTNYTITEYVFGNSNKRVYLAQNTIQKDEYRIIQANLNNSILDIYSDNTISYSNLKQDRIKYNQQRFGSPTPEISSGDNEGLCQREGNETQSQCEDREYDEFVEDCFACWLAYWTNPSVPILISALCLC